MNRSPMRRTGGFKRPSYVHKRVYPSPLPENLRRKASMTPVSTMHCEAIEKEGNKPGKYTPTLEEAQWMADIVELGCICCILDGLQPRETAVHHILSGGRRKGHLFTLPLCPGHHQHDTASGLIARHPFKARFEARYGTEAELLERVRLKIKGAA